MLLLEEPVSYEDLKCFKKMLDSNKLNIITEKNISLLKYLKFDYEKYYTICDVFKSAERLYYNRMSYYFNNYKNLLLIFDLGNDVFLDYLKYYENHNYDVAKKYFPKRLKYPLEVVNFIKKYKIQRLKDFEKIIPLLNYKKILECNTLEEMNEKIKKEF